MVSSTTQARNWLLISCAALLFTILSIGFVNGYRYGVGDHATVIPFVKDIAQPNLYSHDLLVEQRIYYYTFLWHGVSWLYKTFSINLSYLFFTLYFLNIFLIFLGTYLIALSLFKRQDVACLSLFLLLFYRGSLAESPVLETIFITRTAATAIVLFAFHAFLRKRFLISVLLLAIALNVHPLTAVYGVAMIVVAIIGLRSEIRPAVLIKGTFLFLGISSPVLVWKFLYSAESSKLLYADPRWLDVLRLRVPHHHFPFSWSPILFLQAALRLLVFLISWKHAPERFQHRAVLGFTVATFLMMVTGTIFVEWLPVSIIVQLQLFRSFSLLIFFILIYYSNFFIVTLENSTNLSKKVLAALLSLGLFFLFNPFVRSFTFMAILLLLLTYVFYERFKGQPRQRLAIAGILIVTFVFSVAALTGLDSSFALESTGSSKVRAERWFKTKTEVDDLIIVPPEISGFRVESERSLYGDWKDGYLAQLNPEFGYEWLRRMKALRFQDGGKADGFGTLQEIDFQRIAKEMRISDVYVVTYSDSLLRFPLVFENDDFRVYKITFPE